MSSTNRTMQGGYVSRREMPKGSDGRNLCRWCNLEVPRGRLTFCSDWCVSEWRLRTDPGYLRDRVFERDKGICAECGIDTVAEWLRLRRLRNTQRRVALAEWGLTRTAKRRSLWDADHILPVSQGGGECDVSNMRTLCLKCHRRRTSAMLQKHRSNA